MPNNDNNESESAQQTLDKFAENGFKKTSMEEIAKAMGLSRQSVYKRFGSKTACYEWAIDTFLNDLFSNIFALLKDKETAPRTTLLNVFDLYIGKSVDTVRNYHGISVLSDVSEKIRHSDHDWAIRFQARLADFLAEHHFAKAGNPANGLSFLLISAAKGLMLDAESQAQFLQNMTRLLDSALSEL